MTSATVTGEFSEYAGRPRGLGSLALRRFALNPLALVALTVLLVIFGAGALATVLAPNGWNVIDLSAAGLHQPPELSGWHLFGTDWVGRDMLQRTLYGIRTTEEVALAATVIATLAGVLAGALAGYYGGWLDAIVMRVGDLVTAYPAVILTLAAVVYFGEAYPSTLILIFGGYMWAGVARVVRAHIAALREHEFVDAARALGASDVRILFRHLLPNASGTVVVAATALIGQIVLIDATVEFFGYGLPASISPSLGNLVADVVQFKFGLSNDPATAGLGWWTWFFPGLVLVAILVCVNLIGDALDAALNPVATR
jgi:ABC-type dipeptide/oligopeptide/nickel transport system permease subunit